MADVQVFDFSDRNNVNELKSRNANLEKDLQKIIENNMLKILAINFVCSEYSTGRKHAGRIDSLGIDENKFPVIIEYKRSGSDNIIPQGLFYLDWLLDHKAEVKALIREELGLEYSESINWEGTRLICIAANFNRYDEHAIHQIERNIDLVKYKIFDDRFLTLDLLGRKTVKNVTLVKKNSENIDDDSNVVETVNKSNKKKGIEEQIEGLNDNLKEIYDDIVEYVNELGDDVQENILEYYVAFKHLKNFVCVVFRSNCLILTLKIDPRTVEEEDGFIRDVTNIGHHGTGNVEVKISSIDDLNKVKPLIERSYNEN